MRQMTNSVDMHQTMTYSAYGAPFVSMACKIVSVLIVNLFLLSAKLGFSFQMHNPVLSNFCTNAMEWCIDVCNLCIDEKKNVTATGYILCKLR